MSRELTKDGVHDTLAQLTEVEIQKRITQCANIDALVALVNAARRLCERLGVGTWRHGHLDRHALDRLTVSADRQIDASNQANMKKARARDLLQSSQPPDEKTDGKTYPSRDTRRDRRRERRHTDDDAARD